MRAEKCARVCGTRKTGLVSIYFCDCAEEKEKDRETGRPSLHSVTTTPRVPKIPYTTTRHEFSGRLRLQISENRDIKFPGTTGC